MKQNPVERYLTNLSDVRGTRSNVPETSFYPALEQFLTEIGETLSPKVRCVINPANRGAGIPTADSSPPTSSSARGRMRTPTAIPSRPRSRAWRDRGQSARRRPRRRGVVGASRQVLESLRPRAGDELPRLHPDGAQPPGKPVALESFALGDSETEFWQMAAHPHKTATEHGERLVEYLKRVLLHNAPLTAPQDVAALLASYAHDASLRIEHADLPAIASLRAALEEALCLRFEDAKGEHFFRSTLIQTLFYGVFSAWVLWSRRRAKVGQAGMSAPRSSFAAAVHNSGTAYHASGPFDWRVAHHLLRVPILRALFTQVADPARLGALGLTEVLDWTAAALNRVDRPKFFAAFDEGHAVQYFYEPFLQAFDPELRKELGVWYTPEEIVRYQVERVDTVLRSELGLADGLADPQVVVLDPCCGTGAYLRAVLRRIAATLHEKGGDALVPHDLKLAAMTRVPGFDEERDAAGKVKHDTPILVILGNPPYNGFAGVSPEEENGLVEPYKAGLVTEWGIKKFNLDDLYVRFFRLAEKRVAEHGGLGVVSFISNFSYLGDPSFVVARRRLLNEFDSVWLDCMNGDSRETGKVTPDGKPDPSVFSTDWNSAGIRVGTAIGLFVKRDRKHKHDAVVRFRHFWGTRKRDELEASLKVKNFDAAYEVATPTADNRWSVRPSDVGTAYLSWPKLTELCAMPDKPARRRFSASRSTRLGCGATFCVHLKR